MNTQYFILKKEYVETNRYELHGWLPKGNPKKISYFDKNNQPASYRLFNQKKDTSWDFTASGKLQSMTVYSKHMRSAQYFDTLNQQKISEDLSIYDNKTNYLRKSLRLNDKHTLSDNVACIAISYDYDIISKKQLVVKTTMEQLRYARVKDTIFKTIAPEDTIFTNPEDKAFWMEVLALKPDTFYTETQKLKWFVYGRDTTKITRKNRKTFEIYSQSLPKDCVLNRKNRSVEITTTYLNKGGTSVEKYNRLGDKIYVNTCSHSIYELFRFYKYDHKGNWIEKKFYIEDTSNVVKHELRIIEYWK